MSTKLKLMGVDVASIGDAHAVTPGAQNYVYTDEIVYKKLVVSEDRKQLLGAILVGDASDYGALQQLVLNNMPLPEHPEDPILPFREGSKKGVGVDMLPDAALVCSCNSVTKGGFCAAIAEGCDFLRFSQEENKGSDQLRRLRPARQAILDAELKKRGHAVTNHLCEHFPHSRQELFHLVRMN